MVTHTKDSAVRVRGFQRTFEGRVVLRNVDLDVRAGEFVALLGPSGCGKSTLLRALAGLDRRHEGDVRAPRRRSVVFQEPRLLPWKRVWKNVVLGLPGSSEEVRALAASALAEVGLVHHADAWPITLSGGEAQRVALARALVREPELLLLDEPFGALDALTRIKMHALLAELFRKHHPALLLVTHDVDEALLLADRAVVLGRAPGVGEPGSTIVADFRIDVPAPRRRADPRFIELRHALLGHLGVDGEAPEEVSSIRARATGERVPGSASA